MTGPTPISPALIAEQCVCLGLKRAARAVARRYDEALRPLGLNSGQFSMLASIAGLQPVGMQALGEHLAMDRTTVTAALKPLQRRELVQVAVAEGDPRGREISLTRLGQGMWARAVPVWQSQQEDVAGLLSPAQAQRLQRQLAALG